MSVPETSVVLHFDMCRKLRLAFAEFNKQKDEQAAATARAKRETELREGFNRRHTPNNPEAAA
jgi:hypothetical protein